MSCALRMFNDVITVSGTRSRKTWRTVRGIAMISAMIANAFLGRWASAVCTTAHLLVLHGSGSSFWWRATFRIFAKVAGAWSPIRPLTKRTISVLTKSSKSVGFAFAWLRRTLLLFQLITWITWFAVTMRVMSYRAVSLLIAFISTGGTCAPSLPVCKLTISVLAGSSGKVIFTRALSFRIAFYWSWSVYIAVTCGTGCGL